MSTCNRPTTTSLPSGLAMVLFRVLRMPEAFNGSHVIAVQDMGVVLHGGFDSTVPGEGSQHVRLHTLPGQQRNKGMSQRVEMNHSAHVVFFGNTRKIQVAIESLKECRVGSGYVDDPICALDLRVFCFPMRS